MITSCTVCGDSFNEKNPRCCQKKNESFCQSCCLIHRYPLGFGGITIDNGVYISPGNIN